MKNIKTFLIACLLSITLGGAVSQQNKKETNDTINTEKSDSIKTQSLVIKTEQIENLKLHVSISPENAVGTVCYIIETADNLIIIDPHYLKPFSTDFRKYANSLGKKIDRLIVSHEHPDHWFGLDEFKDIPIYTSQGIIDYIKKEGQQTIDNRKEKLALQAPKELVIPSNVIKDGNETISGVKFIFRIINNAEANEQVLITLPEQKIILAQDMVFNHNHQYVDLSISENWISELQKINNTPNINKIYCGHAGPNNIYFATKDDLKTDIEYLQTLTEYIKTSKTFAEFKAKVLQKYPDYTLPDVVNMMSYLFDKKSD
jgi:glyoxylase-like metal-dependent hydrolase (beta-lactamase superfamily II)